MAAHDERGVLVLERLAHHLQQTAGFLGEDRGAEFEHREIGIVHQVDADALGRAHHPHLPREPLELATLDELLFDLLLQFLELLGLLLTAPGRFHRPAGGRARDGDRLCAGLALAVGVIVGIGQRGTAQQPVGPCAFLPHLDQRRREIVGDALALLFLRGAEQPQQQEERHHRGDEVGIGDLPRTAMVAAFDDGHLLDDDGCRNGASCVGHV